MAMTLQEFFKQNPKAALAFSGGADSAYLFYAAKQYGCQVQAYYVHTPFQPVFEYEDAQRFAKELDLPLKVLEYDVLAVEQVRKNPKDRCYYCKMALFEEILKAAEKDGYSVVMDGTNASDPEEDRPGMRALRELGIRSPLRECEIPKWQVRQYSEEAGLFTSRKPAYACLATRIPCGEEISAEQLQRVELAETALFDLGFTDFRVRVSHQTAKLQILPEQMECLWQKREQVCKSLSPYFQEVTLDLNPRQRRD